MRRSLLYPPAARSKWGSTSGRFSFLFAALLVSTGIATSRTTFLVPVDDRPTWRDMAFLAAIPAACQVDAGSPSLIAVDPGGIGPEIQDYVNRYKPDSVFTLGNSNAAWVIGNRNATALPCSSAEEAALAISVRFFKSSRTAVLCEAGDYASGLVAAPLAARLRAPLLYFRGAKLNSEESAELHRLGVKTVAAVGSALVSADAAPYAVDSLADARTVMAWVHRRGLAVSYIAAVNPLDSSAAVIKRLSLSGALLAAGHEGLVAPLRYKAQWKRPVQDVVLKGDLPAGVPGGKAPPKTGSIAAGRSTYPFLLTGDSGEENLRLFVDVTRTGTYGPALASGDDIRLGGRSYAVSLGTRTGSAGADVYLTWPTAERLCQDLRACYRALGAPPKYLCLVGFPDAIPQAIIGHGDIVEEQASDLPYGCSASGPFPDIGVSRVVAESASLATLYAARALTYNEILSPDWDDRACEASWENTYQGLFENAGFRADYRFTADQLPWETAPAKGKPGTRGPSFDEGSPLAHCAAIAHSDHSWWREIGGTFRWDATVLMAPTVVESGGCGTACLDREPDFRSVVARLFRQGAVAFCGSSREAPCEDEPEREEFWNGVLRGETIGEAHRRGLIAGILASMDRKEDGGGAYKYCVDIRTQFGDPGLAIRVPSRPHSAPAHTEVKGDVVSVFAPQKWLPVKIVVPADWSKWKGKDLYVLRASGAYALSDWCDAGYNQEQMIVQAELTTRRLVSGIEQIQKPAAPLGWARTWYRQDNADGSHTYRWAVRMVDFDQIGGRILRSVPRLDYKVTFE